MENEIGVCYVSFVLCLLFHQYFLVNSIATGYLDKVSNVKIIHLPSPEVHKG